MSEKPQSEIDAEEYRELRSLEEKEGSIRITRYYLSLKGKGYDFYHGARALLAWCEKNANSRDDTGIEYITIDKIKEEYFGEG